MIKNDNSNLNKLQEAYVDACKQGNIKLVKYLLTSEVFTAHPDVTAYDCDGFLWACTNGKLDIVDYLLTSEELKIHPNINIYDMDGNCALDLAVENGYIEVFIFLLTSPKLKVKAKLEDSLVIQYLENYNTYEEVVNYLILDYKLAKTQLIENIMNDCAVIKQLFEKRELLENLEQDLKNSSINKKKNKV